MTYKQLLIHIQKMTEEQQNQDVTVCLSSSEEYLPIEGIFQANETEDVLDPGHWCLEVDF